jgi:ABC-type Fe3+/spermidine/putrescine transport system ATPase subunit
MPDMSDQRLVETLLLQVEGMYQSYEGAPLLRDVSLEVKDGEIVCLLGPSGCGKTTLLRIIAGLEPAESGEVRFQGRSLTGVPPHERGIGLMFQDLALFPHKDVAANVAFGLRMQGWSRARVAARVAEMLALVGLEGTEQRRVFELSGGEQQRIALARSLAPGPRLLMLDEPLGALDRTLREELMHELRSILNAAGVSALYVTHDQQEAFAVADRVIVMRRGAIEQVDTPEEVYRRPASPFVARFLGFENLLPGTLARVEPVGVVNTGLGPLRLSSPAAGSPGQAVTLLIRPEAARLAAENDAGDENRIAGHVTACSFRGGAYRAVFQPDQGPLLTFDLSPLDLPPCPPGQSSPVQAGARLSLSLHPDALSLLPVGYPSG